MKARISPEARSLALSIWLQCRAGSEFDQEEAGSMIHAALAQCERETWEAAAQIANREHAYTTRNVCLLRASEVQP
jgi:hypothetical protein